MPNRWNPILFAGLAFAAIALLGIGAIFTATITKSDVQEKTVSDIGQSAIAALLTVTSTVAGLVTLWYTHERQRQTNSGPDSDGPRMDDPETPDVEDEPEDGSDGDALRVVHHQMPIASDPRAQGPQLSHESVPRAEYDALANAYRQLKQRWNDLVPRAKRINEALRTSRSSLAEAQASIREARSDNYRLLATSYAVVCALAFSVGQVVAGAVQAATRGLRLGPPVDGIWHFLSLYTQSIVLAIFAVLVPVGVYSRYRRATDYNSQGLGPVVKIGGFGILFAGGIMFTQLPAELSTLLFFSSEWAGYLPYFNIPAWLYLVITRIVVLPAIGLMSCVVYWRFSRSAG